MLFYKIRQKTIFDMAKLVNMNNKGVGSIIFEKQKKDIEAELIPESVRDNPTHP